MGGLEAAVVLIAILSGILLVVMFDVLCLVHLAAADGVRFLSKLAWAVVIVCISPVGGAAFLLTARRMSLRGTGLANRIGTAPGDSGRAR